MSDTLCRTVLIGLLSPTPLLLLPVAAGSPSEVLGLTLGSSIVWCLTTIGVLSLSKCPAFRVFAIVLCAYLWGATAYVIAPVGILAGGGGIEQFWTVFGFRSRLLLTRCPWYGLVALPITVPALIWATWPYTSKKDKRATGFDVQPTGLESKQVGLVKQPL